MAKPTLAPASLVKQGKSQRYEKWKYHKDWALNGLVVAEVRLGPEYRQYAEAVREHVLRLRLEGNSIKIITRQASMEYACLVEQALLLAVARADLVLVHEWYCKERGRLSKKDRVAMDKWYREPIVAWLNNGGRV